MNEQNLSEIDTYLFENPAMVDRFVADNTDLFKAIKDRFKMYLDGQDVASRYLLSIALNDLVRNELLRSKSQLRKQVFEKLGVFLTDAPKHGGN